MPRDTWLTKTAADKPSAASAEAELTTAACTTHVNCFFQLPLRVVNAAACMHAHPPPGQK